MITAGPFNVFKSRPAACVYNLHGHRCIGLGWHSDRAAGISIFQTKKQCIGAAIYRHCISTTCKLGNLFFKNIHDFKIVVPRIFLGLPEQIYFRSPIGLGQLSYRPNLIVWNERVIFQRAITVILVSNYPLFCRARIMARMSCAF